MPEHVIVTTNSRPWAWEPHRGSIDPRNLGPRPRWNYSINVLELRVIRLAWMLFFLILKGKDVLVRTDYVTAKVFIKRQGGTKSSLLRQEAVSLMGGEEANLASI